MSPYVERVLERYRTLPQTLGRLRRSDRELAAELECREVPLHLVEAALCLAALRRLWRPASAPHLPPIRSLHYILPILEELRQEPPTQEYLDHLTWALDHHDELKHRAPSPPHR